MKNQQNAIFLINGVERPFGLLLLGFMLVLSGCQPSGIPDIRATIGKKQELLYAIEMHGTLCGFKELQGEKVQTDTQILYRISEKSHIRKNLMGKHLFTDIQAEYFMDTTFQRLIYSHTKVDQGKLHVENRINQEGDTLVIRTTMDPEGKRLVLPQNIRFENGWRMPWLVQHFAADTTNPVVIPVFNEAKATIEQKTYTWIKQLPYEINDSVYQAIVLDVLFQQSGECGTVWLSKEDGLILKGAYHTSDVAFYLANRSELNHLQAAKIDDLLFYQVDTIIPNFRDITRMTVRMVINSSGEFLTADGLTYPGQTFTGTVNNNVIDGIFEMTPVRYDGTAAPGYPFDLPLDSTLLSYTKPGFLIESGHPRIKRKAQEILGDDVPDSWEAAKRLSRWVGDEIAGAIPGGGSAIGTLEQGAGECGGHSRLLAALCRSVGIPARLAIGCMYVPDNGGFFGQHAWTEIYMGEAGWIPVDATMKEYDYIDATHIRLGEGTTFYPKEVEILSWDVDKNNL